MLRIYKFFSELDRFEWQAAYVLSEITPDDMKTLAAVVALEMETLAILTHKVDYFIAPNSTVAEVVALIDGTLISKPLLSHGVVVIDHPNLTECYQGLYVDRSDYDYFALVCGWAIRQVFEAGLQSENSPVMQAINDASLDIFLDKQSANVMPGQVALW